MNPYLLERVLTIQTTLQNAIKLGRMKQPSHTDAASILRGLSLFDDDGRLINAAVALYKLEKH